MSATEDNSHRDWELEKTKAEIIKIMAETKKVNKELKWYEVTIIVAATLAVVAIAKLFL